MRKKKVEVCSMRFITFLYNYLEMSKKEWQRILQADYRYVHRLVNGGNKGIYIEEVYPFCRLFKMKDEEITRVIMLYALVSRNTEPT